MKCSCCGSELKEGNKFCDYCGQEVNNTSVYQNIQNENIVPNNDNTYQSNLRNYNKKRRRLKLLLVLGSFILFMASILFVMKYIESLDSGSHNNNNSLDSIKKYDEEKGKSSYVATVKDIITVSKNFVNSGKVDMYDENVTYYIPANCFKDAYGKEYKSSFGKFEEAYVIVTFDGKVYRYYWVSRDEKKYGVSTPISFNSLNETNIKSNVGEIKVTTVEDKNEILMLKNCQEFEIYSE